MIRHKENIMNSVWSIEFSKSINNKDIIKLILFCVEDICHLVHDCNKKQYLEIINGIKLFLFTGKHSFTKSQRKINFYQYRDLAYVTAYYAVKHIVSVNSDRFLPVGWCVHHADLAYNDKTQT